MESVDPEEYKEWRQIYEGASEETQDSVWQDLQRANFMHNLQEYQLPSAISILWLLTLMLGFFTLFGWPTPPIRGVAAIGASLSVAVITHSVIGLATDWLIVAGRRAGR